MRSKYLSFTSSLKCNYLDIETISVRRPSQIVGLRSRSVAIWARCWNCGLPPSKNMNYIILQLASIKSQRSCTLVQENILLYLATQLDERSSMLANYVPSLTLDVTLEHPGTFTRLKSKLPDHSWPFAWTSHIPMAQQVSMVNFSPRHRNNVYMASQCATASASKDLLSLELACTVQFYQPATSYQLEHISQYINVVELAICAKSAGCTTIVRILSVHCI